MADPQTDITPAETDRETIFALALFENPDVREAGIAAGYSETTLSSGYLYQKLKTPKFQAKLKEVAIAKDFQHLSKAYQLEDKALAAALEQAIDNPDSAIKNVGKLKHTIKQKKQINF